MNCIVTAGPTYEPMDEVRRLTNFSTGRLGTELANSLAASGHEVTLLLGEQATHCGEHRAQRVERFSTTADLAEKLRALSGTKVDAIFHAAAVSDFAFGKIWVRSAAGELSEIKSETVADAPSPQPSPPRGRGGNAPGKISTRQGSLLAELVPTPKILAGLRALFPPARIVGWKFEVDGERSSAIRAAEQQLADCRINACVANGPAYGEGFGFVRGTGRCAHLEGRKLLFKELGKLLRD